MKKGGKHKPEKSDSSFNKSLLKYSLVAGTALAMSQPADAEVVCSSPQDGTVNSGSTPVPIDLDGDLQDDFVFFFDSLNTDSIFRTINISATNNSANGFILGGEGPWYTEPLVARLNQGYSVGPAGWWLSDTFGDLNGSYYFSPGTGGYWKTYAYFVEERGCIGVKFIADDGLLHYGWIEYEGTNMGGGSVSGEVIGWGYETEPNTPIDACSCEDTHEVIPSLNHVGLLILAGLLLAGGAVRRVSRKHD